MIAHAIVMVVLITVFLWLMPGIRPGASALPGRVRSAAEAQHFSRVGSGL